MNTMSFNCRGIGSDATVREIRDLTKQFALRVLCVLETQVHKRRVEALCRTLGFDNAYGVSSSGRSGGLCVFWKSDVNLRVTKFSQYHIDTIVSEHGGDPWRLTCWYGDANRSMRYKTWEMMLHVKADSDLPWVCIGDFNEVLRREEHMSISDRSESQMREFRETVDICGLCDIGYIGIDWTFEKKVTGGHYCRIRLDRALVSPSWSSRFPFATLRHLTAACSDHNPILLLPERTDSVGRQNKQFRYELMWETHVDFYSMVEQTWKNAGESTCLAEVQAKLDSLSSTLKNWNRDTFGSVRQELRQLKIKLEELRAVPDRVGPSREEIKIQDRLVELNHREEIMWKQRSRIQWLSEGDKNTKFFHNRSNGRRRRNFITRLTRSDGSLTEDQVEMRQMVNEFYQNLYSSERVNNMQEVLDCVPTKVTDEMNDMLGRPYTEQEIKLALFQMFPSKAPGPDGFPAHFFQRHWSLCGEEITRAVVRILTGEDDSASINSTLLVLIPKVASPNQLTQFRPISLCNVLFKIASKVQANRLKLILPEIISDEQSAFVPGRLITDNIITAYECLHFMKKKKVRNRAFGALKLDMMKAYDRVEWEYLESIMRRLGFRQNWIDSVMRGVRSVSFSVLFNGEKTEFFQPSRGIRQGDPLSPYLFLLASEGLSCLLQHRGNSGRLEGLTVANSVPPINHLLFADDSLLFFKASAEGATEVSSTLDVYCQASGQRINKDKSSIFFSKGCPHAVRENCKAILEVMNESLNERYLGMPSDVGRSRKGAFKYLKDRIWKKVQGWIEQCLSVGGKEVLIKSVVQSIPTFSMSCFKLPRGLCEHINTIIRKFWWGSKGGSRKPAWVSWDIMTQPKQCGGMGFKDIELFNLSLLARQAWRILTNPESLSAKVLKAVYFPQCDLLSATLGSAPSQVWRAVHEGISTLRQGLIRRIGSGQLTKIWEDNWIPRQEWLKPYSVRKDNAPTTVSELIDHTSASWDRTKLLAHFLPMDVEYILSIPLSSVPFDDEWAWFFEKSGMFTVKSAYRMINSIKSRREQWLYHQSGASNIQKEEGSWSKLWKLKVPSKIKVFVWRLARHSIPTADVLHHRNMSTTVGCQICHAVEDSWRHALLSCTMARSVWALMDEDLVEHLTVNDIPEAKQWLFMLNDSLNQEDFTRVVVSLWAIWTARRKALHEDIFQSPLTTFGFIQSFLKDLQMVPIKQYGGVQTSRVTGPSTMIRPPPSFTKVNVDAAVSRDGRGGSVGAICRDEHGIFVGASTRTIGGVTDPTILEAMACAEGLSLAQDLQLQQIRLATDCLEVVQSVRNSSMGRYGMIIKEIKSREAAFSEVQICHEGRKNNMEAHVLARNAVSDSEGRRLWLINPPDNVPLTISFVE